MKKYKGPFRAPRPSTAGRNVFARRTDTKGSRRNCLVQMVGGIGEDRIIQLESYLEYKWCLCLLALPGIADLREQVAFDWYDAEGEIHTHWFDFKVRMQDETVLAYAVRPVARLTQEYRNDLRVIAAQARRSGYDDVRLLTDANLDPVVLHNAELFHRARRRDAEADASAEAVAKGMRDTAPLGDLTDRIGMGPRGLYGLLRLLRRGGLRLLRHQRITLGSLVYPSRSPQP